MRIAPPRISWASRPGFLVVLAAFLLVVLANAPCFTAARNVEIGDLAVNGLQIEAAKRFQELDGPYSRIGLRHPGPAIFYLQALGDRVFGYLPSPLSRYRLAVLVLHLICLTVIARGVARLFSSRLLGVAGAVVVLAGVAAARGKTPLVVVTSTWGPDSAALALVAAVVLGARFWDERRRVHCLGAAVLLSYAVQTQMANVMAAAPVALLATSLLVAYAAQGRLADRLRDVPNLALLALLVVQHLFLVGHVFDWEHSNLRLLLERAAGTAGRHHELSETGGYVLGLLAGMWPGARAAPGGGVSAAQVGAMAAIAAALLLWTVHALASRRASLAGRLAVLAWLVLAGGVLGATWIDGRLMPHFFGYAPGVLVLLVLCLAGAQPRVVFGRPAVVVLLVAIALSTGADIARDRLEIPAPPPWTDTLDAELDVARRPVVEVVLDRRGDDRLWSTYAGIVLELRRRGFQVRTSRDWGFLVPHGVPARPDEFRDVVHLVETPADAPTRDPLATDIPHGVLRIHRDVDAAGLQERRVRAAAWDLRPLVPGREYRYDDKNLLMTGWHAGHGAFRWSDGDSSSLHFKSPTGPLAPVPVLTLRVGAHGRQDVEFALNGTVLDTVRLRGFQQRDVALPVRRERLRTAGVNELRLRFSDPGPVAGSRRVIAVNFVFLRLDPDASGAPRAVSRPERAGHARARRP